MGSCKKECCYTREQIESAEHLAELITRIPKKDEAYVVAVMSAYMDGLLAGKELAEAKCSMP